MQKEIYKNYISSHFGHFHDFDEEIGYIYKLFRRNYLNYLPKEKSKYIVDLGCGMGHFLYFLKKEGYTNYLGVDVSTENVEFCQSKGFKVIELNVFDFLTNCPKVDVFILNDIIEHFSIDDAIRLLDLLREKLSSDGKVIIKTPNGASPLLGNSSMYQDITHKFCYTQISLAQILRIVRFEKIKIIPQDIYIFAYNPFNYLAKFMAFSLNMIFKILFLLYGKKTITIFDKHLIAIATK